MPGPPSADPGGGARRSDPRACADLRGRGRRAAAAGGGVRRENETERQARRPSGAAADGGGAAPGAERRQGAGTSHVPSPGSDAGKRHRPLAPPHPGRRTGPAADVWGPSRIWQKDWAAQKSRFLPAKNFYQSK